MGDPVLANDANNDILTYTLIGDAAGTPDAPAFEIDPATGQITVADDADLDADDGGTDEATHGHSHGHGSGRRDRHHRV